MKIPKTNILYLTKKVLGIVPLVLAVVILNFFLIHMAPGDPVYILAGEAATPEYVERMREKMGLDRPVIEQLFRYLSQVIQGDLGYSYIYGQPVLNLIISRLPATLLLMLPSFIISTFVGVLIGAFSAKKRYSKLDFLITIVSLIGYSVPIFWSGMMLLLLFAVNWRFFPVQGMYTIGAELTGIHHIVDVIRHLILPSCVLTLFNIAVTTRLTRGNTLEALTQDYIVTARSKGLSENKIVFKHALRNSLLPVVTFTGMRTGRMIAGAILTETIFAWPGLGRLLYNALSARDYPVMMGMFLIVSIMVAASNIITDIVYTFLDPRIKYAASQ